MSLSTKPHPSFRRRPVTRAEVARMPNYSLATDVDRIDGRISAAEFARHALDACIPVLLVGGAQGWPAVERWQDTRYLERCAGATRVGVTKALALDATMLLAPKQPAGSEHFSEMATAMPLGRYLDRITHEFDPDQILYARNIEVPAPIARDVGDIPYDGARWTSMFLGRLTFTDSHEHWGKHAFLCQVSGTKEVILHPPDELHDRALYGSRSLRNWSPVRFFDVDLESFPDFAMNRPMRALVRPGDVLFIPNPWWHAVVSADDGVQATVTSFFPPTRLDPRHPQTRRSLMYRDTWRFAVSTGTQTPSALDLTRCTLGGFASFCARGLARPLTAG